MSYGEPIALRGQMDLEQVATAAPVESRPVADVEFIERLKRGEAAAFEILIAEFIELFGTIGKAVDQYDHVFGLFSVVIELGNTDISGEVLIILFLHRLDAPNCFFIRNGRSGV